MKKLIIGVISIWILFSGCVNSLEKTINSSNKSLNKNNQPYTYVKTKSTNKANFYNEVWIGSKGNSITNNSPVLKNDVFKGFSNNCGLEKNNLKEIRVVFHDHPYYKEVWIFNDSKSKRKDKTSAMTVLLKAIPNGGVDMNLIGQCHQEPKQIIFGK